MADVRRTRSAKWSHPLVRRPHNICVTTPIFPGLSLAEAEREIHAHIFDRRPEGDHESKLRRVAMALQHLGDPQDELRIVHVTGTNGKTSTSRMTASLLRAQGLRVGLFTSPHLHSLRERIQIDGAPLGQPELIELWQRVAPIIHRVDTYSLRVGGPRMSFFEVLTVLGFVAFADARVGAAVIEVGIGGQRDATNVCDGEVAVLTPMALDHESYFGDSVVGVALEKTGIIKQHATVVSAAQVDEAAEVITGVSRQRRASLLWEGAHMSVEDRVAHVDGQTVTLRTAAGTYPHIDIPLHGDFQAQNALVALAAAEVFIGNGVPRELEHDAVYAGFAEASSPGRMEQVANHPLVVVDAAHNPHGIAAITAAVRETVGERALVGVVAVLSDKDGAGILEGIEPLVDAVVVTRTCSPRATDPHELGELARPLFGDARVIEALSVEDALARACDMAGASGAVLCTGSVTLVSEVREVLSATSSPDMDQPDGPAANVAA